MRLCTSIPPITATTLCCSVPDPTIATGGDTMIGVAYFPAKSAATIQEGWRLPVARWPAPATRQNCLFLWGAYKARAGQQALHYNAK